MKLKLANDTVEVRFRHKHFADPVMYTSNRFDKPKRRLLRGHTQAALYINGRKIATSYGRCAFDDTFDPAIGRKQALRHLLEDWFIPRQDRTLFWAAFHENEQRIKRGDHARPGKEEVQVSPIEGRETEGEASPIQSSTPWIGISVQQTQPDTETEWPQGC